MKTEKFSLSTLRTALFAGATVATVLGSFSISYGQKKDTDVVDASKMEIIHITSDCKGDLFGVVIDPFGAVISGAKISVFDKKKETGSSVSNVTGQFRIPDLAYGEYTLKVTSPAFRTLIVENIKMSGVECLELTLEMKVNPENIFDDLGEPGIPIDATTSSYISTTIITRPIPKPPH